MTADDLIEQGNQRFVQHDLQGAIELFTRATASDPTSRVAWYNLGVACLHQGDRVGGVVAVAGSIKVVSPNDVWYVRAIAAFTRALAIEPDHQPSRVMRAHAHLNRLDDEHARADLTEAARAGDTVARRQLERRGWPVPPS